MRRLKIFIIIIFYYSTTQKKRYANYLRRIFKSKNVKNMKGLRRSSL